VVLQPIFGQLATGGQDTERDGQVEGTAVFANVRRREIDRDSPQGKRESGIGERCAYPFPALLDRAVRKADGREARQTIGDVHFDVHGVGIDPENGGGPDTGEHAIGPGRGPRT
jgi:hypothetical protein